MDKDLIEHLSQVLSDSILHVSPISGGDISRAYLLETLNEKFFCKFSLKKGSHAMFLLERQGLLALSRTNTIAIPTPILIEPHKRGSIFLMEYIESKKPNKKDMELFGRTLAQLHLKSGSDFYGFNSDNFIGSLHQSNKKHWDWLTFYVKERLVPQLKMACDQGLLNRGQTPSENRLIAVCRELFPSIRPSLLHGDLWTGNFLVSCNGVPYLIDPAVYYGHHEVDLAMTKLFGGFGDYFYQAYREFIPPEPGENERTDIYQLYYLLVHLNLFGSSYRSSVQRILSTYF